MKKLLCLLAVTFCLQGKAQLTTLFNFSDSTNGSYPAGSLYYDGTFLYGMGTTGGIHERGTIFKIEPDGSGYAKLLDFSGSANGSEPWGSLISDGTFLYGTTQYGGTNGVGTVFKIKPDGTGFIKLADFIGSNGLYPQSDLYYDGTYMYGTTYGGGSHGFGTIFKLKPDGTNFTSLYSFDGVNGSGAYGSLISDGTFLYGMLPAGGTDSLGVIYKIKPDGTSFTKLLDFVNTNGGNPYGSLIYDGNFLYGMTFLGGANNKGLIFKIKTNGTSYTKILDFDGANGADPNMASLMYDGNFLYSMTEYGGANNQGLIFKIKPDGTGYADLYDFLTPHGAIPFGSLITDGTFLYGMTEAGGGSSGCLGGCGSVFKFQYAPLGINQLEDNNQIAIYPNPAQNNFTIETNSSDKQIISVFDINGKLILSQTINGTTSIDASNFAAGVYNISIASNSDITNKHLVIIK